LYNLSAFSIEYVPWWEEVEDTDSLKASARRRRNATARLAGPFVMPPGFAKRTRHAAAATLLVDHQLTAAIPHTRSAEADLVVYRALEGDAQRVRQAMDASLEKPGYVYGTAQRVRQAEGSLETRHFVRVYSGAPRLKVYSPDPRVTLVSDYRMTVRDWGPRLQKGIHTLSGSSARVRQATAMTGGDPVMLSTPSEPATAERVRSGEADLQRVLVMDGDGERVRLAEGNLNLVMALEGSAQRQRAAEGDLSVHGLLLMEGAVQRVRQAEGDLESVVWLWRIPTDEDWKAIEGTVDSTYGVGHEEWDGTGFRGDDAGAALAGEADLWDSGSLKDNARFGESGFDALPGGYRMTSGSFYYEGRNGYFWSSSVSSGSAWWRGLYRSYSEVVRYASSQGLGFSLRCLRDDSGSDIDGTVYTDDYEGNDGKKYDSVKIGDFAVINENLDETKYADGTDIPVITGDTDWENDTDGARCYYNNDEAT